MGGGVSELLFKSYVDMFSENHFISWVQMASGKFKMEMEKLLDKNHIEDYFHTDFSLNGFWFMRKKLSS